MTGIDFTNGSITKNLLLFFFPLLLTNTLQQAYTFADTVIIGRGLGDDALAAVGNFGTFSFFVTGFSMGIMNGFSVNFSYTFGSGNMTALRKIFGNAAALAVIVTAVLTAAGSALLYPVMRMMRTSDAIMHDSLVYGYIIFGGLFAAVFYNLCSALLRAVGDSRTPFTAICISSLVNIVLDLLFVYVLKTGVSGPAFATVFSQLVSGLICVYRLAKNKTVSLRGLSRDDLSLNGASAKSLLKNGIPMACMNSVTSVGCIFVQGCINGFGAAYTSAYSVCSKYLNLFMLPGITAGFTSAAFTGQNCGAGDLIRIRKGTKISCLIAAVSALLLGAALFAFPEQLARLMLSGDEAVACTVMFLKRFALFLVLLNLLFVFRNTVQALGKPFIPMCSGIAEMLLRIPVIMFGLPLIGFKAAAYAECAAWAGALAINAFFYLMTVSDKVRQ